MYVVFDRLDGSIFFQHKNQAKAEQVFYWYENRLGNIGFSFQEVLS